MKTYNVTTILNYNSNNGDVTCNTDSFGGRDVAEYTYDLLLSQECSEHGMACEIGLWEVEEGQEPELLKSDYQKSALLPKDGVVVTFAHTTYMNYCYTILDVQKVEVGQRYESLAVSEDHTNRPWDAVYDSIEEMEADYRKGNGMPFNKTNKGRVIVESFLADNGFADYQEVEEESDDQE
jgi:hypothetical protein